MPTESEILAYYAARANEYEKVYACPARQRDLLDLHKIIPAYLSRRRVLDVACGTGYWTRLIAPRAAAVTGVDLSPEVLAIAKAHQPMSAPATFVIGDAFALDQVSGTFDAAFLGFWWSHIPDFDLHRFLTGLHERLGAGALVVVLDNRCVEASSPLVDYAPSPESVQGTIAIAGGTHISTRELQDYWYAAYTVAG
jgi:Methylase involved in ubiquinone/menaquinone biosynthesis